MDSMKASRQWASRPDDERFTSLIDLRDHFHTIRNHSRGLVIPSSTIHVEPDTDNSGLKLISAKDYQYDPTHWAFGQMCQRIKAPASYLRELPSPIVADCINYGFLTREVEDTSVMFTRMPGQDVGTLRAVTGPRYGRVWNHEVADALVNRFGNGCDGDWRVPGEFGKSVAINKANTTIYGSDRDMFVFLADERNRIEVPQRRDGKSGSLARGFFVWNSEVGAATIGVGFFLFDYVCCNRIVWGGQDYTEIKMRHSVSAPVRWLDEIEPTILEYSRSSANSVQAAIEAAQKHKLDKVDDFLSARWGKQFVEKLKLRHEAEEGRPIETLWDATVAATAIARDIPHQNERVKVERIAGDLIRQAA